MNITVEKQPNCVARIRVEVPADVVTGERKQILQAFSRQAKIPGYRPGKVPMSIIEKRFGTQIAEELETRLLGQAFEEAIKEKDLRVLEAKRPEETTHSPDGSFSFTSELILAPNFELPDYANLVIEIPDREVEDADVDREIEQLQNRFADFNDITDRPAADGDFAVINYSSSVEGTPLEEKLGDKAGYLASGDDYWLKMDEDSFLPGFCQHLEGAAIDEEREFAVTLGEEFPIEDLRGVDLDFKVKVTGIKEQILPELNDEFAAQVLPEKSLEDLRTLIREQLGQQLAQQVNEFKVNQLVQKLSEAVDFELPEHLVTAETQGQADEMVERGVSSGMSEEEIEAQQAEIFAAAGQRARLNIKTDFILQEIASTEDLEVSDTDLGERVVMMAQQAKKPVKAFTKELQKSGRLRGLRHSMLLSKTIDFLLDGAKFETVSSDDADEAAAATESNE